jgi:deoxyadenosine/deoxycytidine kinase
MLISIEGYIGSGKSTLLDKLKENDDFNNKKIIFLQEPVKEWESIQNIDGSNMLTLYYNNPTKYAFSFQMMAYISRLSDIKKAIIENPDSIIISERCLDTDRYVFAKMLYDSNNLEDVEYQIYLKWFDHFSDIVKMEKTIYLKTDPYICFERIAQRNRDGESNISLEYLSSCHNYHEAMINKIRLDNNILIINSNNNINEDNNLDNWINIIKNFIFYK